MHLGGKRKAGQRCASRACARAGRSAAEGSAAGRSAGSSRRRVPGEHVGVAQGLVDPLRAASNLCCCPPWEHPHGGPHLAEHRLGARAIAGSIWLNGSSSLPPRRPGLRRHSCVRRLYPGVEAAEDGAPTLNRVPARGASGGGGVGPHRAQEPGRAAAASSAGWRQGLGSDQARSSSWRRASSTCCSIAGRRDPAARQRGWRQPARPRRPGVRRRRGSTHVRSRTAPLLTSCSSMAATCSLGGAPRAGHPLEQGWAQAQRPITNRRTAGPRAYAGAGKPWHGALVVRPGITWFGGRYWQRLHGEHHRA